MDPVFQSQEVIILVGLSNAHGSFSLIFKIIVSAINKVLSRDSGPSQWGFRWKWANFAQQIA